MNLPEGYIGLCAYCILNLNAAYQFSIGHDNQGVAKDREGESIAFGPDDRLDWRPGLTIPPGFRLSLIFLTFGADADIRRPGSNQRVMPFAVTMREGTLVCSDCNSTWPTTAWKGGRR